MQEMFNKDLEAIKNSQSIMNNAITEIKKLGNSNILHMLNIIHAYFLDYNISMNY